MHKSEIEAACAQYCLGFSAAAASMTAEARKAAVNPSPPSGAESEFYEQGLADGAATNYQIETTVPRAIRGGGGRKQLCELFRLVIAKSEPRLPVGTRLQDVQQAALNAIETSPVEELTRVRGIRPTEPAVNPTAEFPRQ